MMAGVDSRMAWPRRTLLVLLLFICAPLAAHKPSDSEVLIRSDASSTLMIDWSLELRDLEHAIGLDSDADGRITWGELRQAQARIEAYALPRLSLSTSQGPCPNQAGELLVRERLDQTQAVLRFSAECPDNAGQISVRYALLFDLDPSHRGFLRHLHDEGESSSPGASMAPVILSPQRPVASLSLASRDGWDVFVEFLRHGVWHIWIGADHMLFLFTLILPVMLVRRQGRWQPAGTLRAPLLDLLKLVTAFTVAHSITLALAALEIVVLPSRAVESVIALSVLVVALNNLFPLFVGSRWTLAFAFGLVHGFGFANVLGELGLQSSALVISLLGFNLGVELGQLAVVAVLMPLLLLARRAEIYPRLLMPAGSVVCAVIACAWLLDRVLDLGMMPF